MATNPRGSAEEPGMFYPVANNFVRTVSDDIASTPRMRSAPSVEARDVGGTASPHGLSVNSERREA